MEINKLLNSLSKPFSAFIPQSVIQKRKIRQELSNLESEVSNRFEDLRGFFLREPERFFENPKELEMMIKKKISSSGKRNLTGATVTLPFICDPKKYELRALQVGSLMVCPKIIIRQPEWILEEVEATAYLFRTLKKDVIDVSESSIRFSAYFDSVILYFKECIDKNSIRSSNWLILKMTEGILHRISGSELDKKYSPIFQKIETTVVGWPN